MNFSIKKLLCNFKLLGSFCFFMKTFISCGVFLILFTQTANAQTKLKIVKGIKTQLEYKQGDFISLKSRNETKINSGIIYLVTPDSLYLNNYTLNVSLQDIIQVLPIFKPNFKIYQPSDFKEWLVGIFMSVMALTTFSYDEFRDMWFPNATDNINLSSKERKLRKKTFNIGSKFKLTTSN